MAAILVKLGIVSLALGPLAAVADNVGLTPIFTKENGLSCGRTLAMPEGVECDSPQCYDTSAAREFRTWADFEQGFLRDEAKRSGLTTGPSDFTDLCPGSRYFTPDEKELLWLDFLKLMAAFESNFLWLDTYDDLVDGRIVTERGFFQVSKPDCQGLPEVQKDYCALHWPKVNARCALAVLNRVVRGRRGKTIDAIATHWGSMRSAARNGEGGRREKLQKTFQQHPACQYQGPTIVAAGKKRAKQNTPQAQASQAAPATDDPARPRYDRLKPRMYPDPDFARATILPSYRASASSAASCSAANVTDPEVMKKCRRFLNWKHYQEVDLEYADKHP